jgi:hypothetical protein
MLAGMEVGVLALPAPPLKPLPDIEPAPVTSEVEGCAGPSSTGPGLSSSA